MELGPEDVSLLERCLHFRGWYVQVSMELGPEDGSLLERCPHFRGWYVHASMELVPEDVSLLERCPHFIIHRLILSLFSPQATVRCLKAPPERFQTGYRTYNIQAVNFTPGELMEEMKKHIPNFAMEYRPDERQEIGRCGLVISGRGLLMWLCSCL